MEIGRRDYSTDEVDAARKVLTELAHLFAEERLGVVLVGGWVPYFAVPQDLYPHEGTKDVDLALDPGRLSTGAYQTLGEKLLNALYQQNPRKPFRYERSVIVNGNSIRVIVDFLAAEQPGIAEHGQIRDIQDIQASTMHGCEIAFVSPVEHTFSGEHPDGGMEEITVQVASLPAFLIMKAFALKNRGGADARKDAYDIYYCLRHYPGSLFELADQFGSLLKHPLTLEGLNCLADRFASVNHLGPKLASDRADTVEDRDLIRRDAYERANTLIEQIHFPSVTNEENPPLS